MDSARPNLETFSRHAGRYGLAFAAGFCMMAVELMAGRLMAPHLGSSLYTWTAVIASVMAGVGLGAALGGRYADKHKHRPVLGPAFVLAALAVAATLLLARLVGPLVASSALPIQLLTFLFALCVFLPPSLFLGSLTPMLLARKLTSKDETGEVYGSLGAWNAAGSILGVYSTGFLLIGYVPTHAAYLAIAFALALIGATVWVRERGSV